MLKYILISFLIITNAYAYTCEEMGYTKSIADCPEGGLKCPAQPEKMFCCDPCGNKGVYRFNEENCSPDDGLQLVGIECGGGWSECRQCSSEYKYNKDNCRSPKILAGVQCGNAYTQCVYPSGIGCVPTVGNTDKSVSFALSSGKEQKAPQYCANKTTGDMKWYLPALGELNALYSKIDEIQTSLASIPEVTQLSLSNYYWSSTESSKWGVWLLNPTNGAIKNVYQHYTNTAICFASF